MIFSRTLLLSSALIAAFFSCFSVQAETTARGALTILEHQVGAVETANVVAIVGFRGQNQPKSWAILVLDPQNNQQLKEYTVENQRLTAGPKIIPRDPKADMPSTPVLLSSLAVDSSDAFRAADDMAIASGIAFDSINYQLRWRGNDSEPTWLTTLIDSRGKSVGSLYITSGTGKVLHHDFSIAQQGQPASGPARPPQGLTPVSARAAQQQTTLRPIAEVTPILAAPRPQPAPVAVPQAQPQPRPQPQPAPRPQVQQPQQQPIQNSSAASNIWLLNPGKRRAQRTQQQNSQQRWEPAPIPQNSSQVPERYRPR
ncbi:MAG: hypothetical protein AAF585_25060 [Verrucomicrobiota bacterium]